jgi:hypothetical protein
MEMECSYGGPYRSDYDPDVVQLRDSANSKGALDVWPRAMSEGDTLTLTLSDALHPADLLLATSMDGQIL